jgi:pyruvate/2-oxoglutarate dehydrogenase complex dihydrolipoamide acyltransferase (E2) component
MKATLSFDTTDDGYIAKILAETGVSVQIGAPIAVLVDTAEGMFGSVNFFLILPFSLF